VVSTERARSFATWRATWSRRSLCHSDLFEGGNNDAMLGRAQALVSSGVQVIALLALSDDGAPGYDHDNATALASLGIPAFACTPDQFPDLIAAAIQRGNLTDWVAANDITPAAPTADHPFTTG